MMITNEMKEKLIAAGLSKQQASSATAETCVRLFMNDDDKQLTREAALQVEKMQKMVSDLQQEYYNTQQRIMDLHKEIKNVSDTILAISKAQDEYGTVTDEKARTVVALYGALCSMNAAKKVDPDISAQSVGYIVYAYLGGEARKENVFESKNRE